MYCFNLFLGCLLISAVTAGAKKPMYYKICKSSSEETGHKALAEPYEVDQSVPTNCPHLIRPKSTPFEYIIPGGLAAIRAIHIAGKPPQKEQSFKISFIYGSNCPYSSYIPFRIRFDMSERNITRNTQVLGEWGPEENYSLCEYSLNEDRVFQLTIRITEKRFKIYFNGNHCFDYYHRLPHPLISIMKIEGAVQILSLSMM